MDMSAVFFYCRLPNSYSSSFMIKYDVNTTLYKLLLTLYPEQVDITWFKIASFYNLVSGTAVDCVKQGHPG